MRKYKYAASIYEMYEIKLEIIIVMYEYSQLLHFGMSSKVHFNSHIYMDLTTRDIMTID